MRVLSRVAVFLALVGLTACQTTAGSGQSEVLPGATDVDPVVALDMYRRICTDTAPSFSGAADVLSTLPFKQHPTTGTYFHQSINMSFKIVVTPTLDQCSMVIGSRKFNAITATMMSATSSKKLATQVGTPYETDGIVYLAVFGRVAK